MLRVFTALNDAGLTMKIEKCFSGIQQRNLLDQVDLEGIPPYADRCDTIRNFEVRHTKEQEKCAAHLADISKPLSKLLRKEYPNEAWKERTRWSSGEPENPVLLTWNHGTFQPSLTNNPANRCIRLCYGSIVDTYQRQRRRASGKTSVLLATEMFRTMLLGREFILKRDHLVLRNLLKDKTHSNRKTCTMGNKITRIWHERKT